MRAAYLDIETTGLSFDHEITVIGIGLSKDGRFEVVQLVGKDATRGNLLKALGDVHKIYTYNGSRFDLPFINTALGVDLAAAFLHHDLMYDCWERNLFGGFKAVEEMLSIPRRLKGVTGVDAVKLWYRYKIEGDRGALKTLLEYNREDVVNLRVLRSKLLT
ncbi:MAG: ribonuclease H-like domain-containing protein [Chloroflexi bacterium]|nr:ribonuclease H-like domain-containing protein [Chloroflexota bacterium]